MGVKPVLIYMRTWIWGHDSLRGRVAGNKIENVYTLLNTKIMKAQKSDEKRGKKKGSDNKSAATEGVTYKAGGF